VKLLPGDVVDGFDILLGGIVAAATLLDDGAGVGTGD